MCRWLGIASAPHQGLFHNRGPYLLGMGLGELGEAGGWSSTSPTLWGQTHGSFGTVRSSPGPSWSPAPWCHCWCLRSCGPISSYWRSLIGCWNCLLPCSYWRWKKGGAHGLPVLAEAVSDDVVSVLHPDCLEGVLKVLAVILRDEGPQTEKQELRAVPTELQQVHTEPEHQTLLRYSWSRAENCWISWEDSLLCSMACSPIVTPWPRCSACSCEVSWHGTLWTCRTRCHLCAALRKGEGAGICLVWLFHVHLGGSVITTVGGQVLVGVEVPSNMGLSRKLMVDSVYMIWKTCLRSSTATWLSMASITRQQTPQTPLHSPTWSLWWCLWNFSHTYSGWGRHWGLLVFSWPPSARHHVTYRTWTDVMNGDPEDAFFPVPPGQLDILGRQADIMLLDQLSEELVSSLFVVYEVQDLCPTGWF